MAGSSSQRTERINDSENGLVLYNNVTSYCCQKVVFTLHEKRLKFKSEIVDLFAGEHFEPWFINSVNARLQIPVLKDGVKLIPDSNRIIDYLEDNFSNGNSPRLTPNKTSSQYQTMEHFRALLDDVQNECITFGCIFHPELSTNVKIPPDEKKSRLEYYESNISRLDEYAEKHKEYCSMYMLRKKELEERLLFVQDLNNVKRAIRRMGEALVQVEVELQSHRKEKKQWWLCSEKFTIADITLCVLLQRLKVLGLADSYLNDPYFSNLKAYFQRCQRRDAFRKTMNQGSSFLRSFYSGSFEEDVFLVLGGTAVIACVAAFLYRRIK